MNHLIVGLAGGEQRLRDQGMHANSERQNVIRAGNSVSSNACRCRRSVVESKTFFGFELKGPSPSLQRTECIERFSAQSTRNAGSKPMIDAADVG